MKVYPHPYTDYTVIGGPVLYYFSDLLMVSLECDWNDFSVTIDIPKYIFGMPLLLFIHIKM